MMAPQCTRLLAAGSVLQAPQAAGEEPLRAPRLGVRVPQVAVIADVTLPEDLVPNAARLSGRVAAPAGRVASASTGR